MGSGEQFAGSADVVHVSAHARLGLGGTEKTRCSFPMCMEGTLVSPWQFSVIQCNLLFRPQTNYKDFFPRECI